MDLQKLFDALADSNRRERSRYHLTLGGLIAKLTEVPSDALVKFDHGAGVGQERSYRGYYSDLSFDDGLACTVAELLARCVKALNGTYEGYKGGDNIMGPETPLWNAAYGCTGSAIMGCVTRDGQLVLETKDLDA